MTTARRVILGLLFLALLGAAAIVSGVAGGERSIGSCGSNPSFGFAHQEASGSGVIIAPEGYIITHRHVINGIQSLQVIFRDGQRVPASLVGADAFVDLAVIKVDVPVPAVAVLVNSSALKPSETLSLLARRSANFRTQ